MQQKPVAELWYAIRPYEPSIIRIAEIHIDPYAVGDIWLVKGADRSLVLDTGSGIVASAPIVDAVAETPVLAIALNTSYDHAGGWPGFTERACHALDVADLEHPRTNTREVFDYLTDEMFFALPHAGYSPSQYVRVGASPTQLLADGDVIDLGNRRIHVLHTPGRCTGGLSLWEPATASLFPGEMLYDGDHGPAWPPSDAPSYCASLRRLRELPAATVFAGHYGPFGRARMLTLIDEQLADLEPLL